MIGEKISHYLILEKIGEGGMGVIYRAEDTKLKREVALKFLPHHLTGSEEDRTRFRNEARAASALNHPNITTIYEIDEVGSDTFIAMEYLKGRTLKEIMDVKKLTNRDIIEVGEAISRALSEAHNMEIVHRDIKSENIMILENGNVKIMDFGLAKRKGDNLITKKGVTMGTVAYMSPEQVEGKEVDYRTDIFSLGVILYEMATGDLPFRGEHEAAILYSIVNESPPLPGNLNSDIHPELARMIMQTLEKKAENRYQSAETFVTELKKLKENLDSKQFLTRTIVPDLAVEENESRTRDRKSRLYLTSAVMIVLALLAIVFQGQLKDIVPFTDGNPGGLAALQPESENSLAVLYFDNLQDPDDTQRLGQILQELVIADLSEMPTLKVFSSRRLFDIQKQLGSDSRRIIDPDLATEIAQRAGASKMLTGKVMQVGEKTIITSQLIDTYDGSIIESQRVEGSDIYVLVDELVHQIQAELEVSQADIEVASQSVKEKTSTSMTAYQAYLQGMDHFNDSHFDLAIEKFREAIMLDSTFTRAYYELAMSLWWFSSLEGGPEARREAKYLVDRIMGSDTKLSTKDRLLMNAVKYMVADDYARAEEIYAQLVMLLPDEKDAWFGLGEAIFHGSYDLERSLDAFEQVLKLDPEFSLAYRHIFDVYRAQGAYTRGLVRADQYVSLNPDDPWGYIFMADMLIARENTGKALESLSKAVELDPGNSQALMMLVKLAKSVPDHASEIVTLFTDALNVNPELENLYVHLSSLYKITGKDSEGAETARRGLMKFPDNLDLIGFVARNYVLEGDLQSGLDFLDQNINSAKSDNAVIRLSMLRANLLAQSGKYIAAMDFISGINDRYSESDPVLENEVKQSILLWAFFGLGRSDSSLAVINRELSTVTDKRFKDQLLYGKALAHYQRNEKEEFLSSVEEFDGETIQKFMKPYIDASIALLDGNIDSAAEVIDSLKYNELYDFVLTYNLTISDIETGNFDRAERNLARFTAAPSSIIGTIYYPRSYYLKGLLYEAKGEDDKAVQAFESLLEIWIDADDEIPELQNIFEHLVKLRRPS